MSRLSDDPKPSIWSWYHGNSPQPPVGIDRVAADELLLAAGSRGSASAASTRSGSPTRCRGTTAGRAAAAGSRSRSCRRGGRRGCARPGRSSCARPFGQWRDFEFSRMRADSTQDAATTTALAADLDLLLRLAIDVARRPSRGRRRRPGCSRDHRVRAQLELAGLLRRAAAGTTASRRTIRCRSPRCSCRSSGRRDGPRGAP